MNQEDQRYVSGDGADPNVITCDVAGVLPPTEEPLKPRVQRMIVRDLTDDTEGNATGIGMADIVLRRAVERMDPIATYMNMITAKAPQGARIPFTVDTDRQAIYVALACCLKTQPESSRIACSRDTKHFDNFWASEPLLPELLESGRVEVTGDLRPIAFDEAAMLSRLGHIAAHPHLPLDDTDYAATALRTPIRSRTA